MPRRWPQPQLLHTLPTLQFIPTNRPRNPKNPAGVPTWRSLLNFGQYALRSGSYLSIILPSGILDVFRIGAKTFSAGSPLLYGADTREQRSLVRVGGSVRILGSLWVEIRRICIGRFWSARAFVGFGRRGGDPIIELHHGPPHWRWSRFFPQTPSFTTRSIRRKTCKSTSRC